MNGAALIHHYFVDEAGDLTLFNKRGRVIVGQPGVSNFFMVGVAHLLDPDGATQKLESLRQDLLGDPYFLHKADKNEIVFARRGSSERKDALQNAIVQAKKNFARRWGDPGDTPTEFRLSA